MTAPVLPWLLGLAGLVPFWALVVALFSGVPHGAPAGQLGFALAAYGATIIAFLGGVQWGLAVARQDDRRPQALYLVSVLPQLFGWAALMLPDPLRLVVLGVIMFGTGVADVALARRGVAPAWFGRLRLVLSLGAGAALLVAALA